MLSVIIPTHNRKENIRLCLTGLKLQEDIDKSDFEVILIDDGSTDRTYELISSFKDEFNFKYAWINKKVEWNASTPRNYGAKLADKTSEAFLFLDSDVVLNRKALSSYIKLLPKAQKEKAVVIGPYNWLPPQLVTENDIQNNFESFINGTLTPRLSQHRGSHVGPDMRAKTFEDKEMGDEIFDGLACFGGNLLFPREMFWNLGGYDEDTHCGIEDGEMGIRIWKKDYKFIYNKEGIGYHIWHTTPPSRFPPNLKDHIAKLNQKHFKEDDPDLGIVNATKEVYKRWGMVWEKPEEWKR